MAYANRHAAERFTAARARGAAAAPTTCTGLADTTESSLLDALSDGVVLIDPDWTVRHVNLAAAALLGVDPAQVAGRRIGTDVPEPPAERMAVYREVMRDRRMRRLGGVALDSPEMAGRRFDGEVHPSPTGGIVLVFRDVTERAAAEGAARARADEAERRIRESEALREIGRDLLSRTDPDTVLHRIARHARDLLGAGYAAVAGWWGGAARPRGRRWWGAGAGAGATTLFPPGQGTAGPGDGQQRAGGDRGLPRRPGVPARRSSPSTCPRGCAPGSGCPCTTRRGGPSGR